MKKLLLVNVFALAALTLSACGAVQSVVPSLGGGSGNNVAELWPDVPRMDGLNASDIQMPFMAEMFMQTMVGQAAVGDADVAVFNTAKTATDIQAFYSSERMAASGWNTGDVTTCFTGSEQGIEDIGLFCVYQKESGATETVLVIIAAPDEASGQNSVFFVRLEGTATPES